MAGSPSIGFVTNETHKVNSNLPNILATNTVSTETDVLSYRRNAIEYDMYIGFVMHRMGKWRIVCHPIIDYHVLKSLAQEYNGEVDEKRMIYFSNKLPFEL